jgi:flagellar protein FlaI
MKTEPKTVKEKNLSMFREVYPIEEPYVFAAIVKDPITQKIRYQVIEPTLREKEEEQLREIKDLLVEEIDVSLGDLETKEKAREYLKNKVQEIIKNYRMEVAEEAVDKLMYYITRDFIGYGKCGRSEHSPLRLASRVRVHTHKHHF